MNWKTNCAGALLSGTLLGLYPSALEAAPSSAELLEKGIFAQETRKDLEEALNIYDEILKQAGKNNQVLAETLYRKGAILKKQGKTKEANAAFAQLIKEYPKIQRFVKAAKRAQVVTLPLKKPWEKGEVMQADLAMGGNPKTVIGHEWRWVEENEKESIFHSLTGLNGIVYNFSEISADPKTLLPIKEKWNVFAMGELEAEYDTNEVNIQIAGRDKQNTMKWDGIAYANDQVVQIRRCLPFEANENESISTVSSFGGVILDFSGKLEDVGEVKVPAGNFDCFKLSTIIGQDFWFAKDDHHYLVKAEVPGIIMNLKKVFTRDFSKAYSTTPSEMGVSFTLPPNWFLVDKKSNKSTVLSFFAPVSKMAASGTITPKRDLPEAEQKSVKAFMNAYVERAKRLKNISDVKFHGDTEETTINGNPAIERILTFNGATIGERKEYIIWILGENAVQLEFATTPEAFDDHLETFRQIAQSVTGK